MFPMPPSTTMETTMMDSTSTKLSGETNPWIAEKCRPRRRRTWLPWRKRAASRAWVDAHRARGDLVFADASQARPMREFWSRTLMKITASSTASSK